MSSRIRAVHKTSWNNFFTFSYVFIKRYISVAVKQKINNNAEKWNILIISLGLHVFDCVLGEMSFIEALLYQPLGIWAMNISGGPLVLRRISCCYFAVAEISCIFFFLELPSEMWTVWEILIGFWSRALPAKNKSKLEIVCNGSMWQKHLQSCHWKCLFCWVYMANRIQINEQRNGLLSRLDIVDEMFAGSMYHESCFCTPSRGCHTS